MGTAMPLGTPVRGVTPSPPPCWAGLEQGGWCGAGVWAPQFHAEPGAVILFIFHSSSSALQGSCEPFAVRGPPGGVPGFPPASAEQFSPGDPWCPPSSFPPPVLLGGMGALRVWGTSCCQAPPVLQGCPPRGAPSWGGSRRMLGTAPAWSLGLSPWGSSVGRGEQVWSGEPGARPPAP